MDQEGFIHGRDISILAQDCESILIEFDGSLTGIGVRLFDIQRNKEGILIGEFGYLTGINLEGDSSYQNAMELMALTAGVAIMVALGWREVGIAIRGDSQSVLHWAQKLTFNSSRCVGCVLFLALLLEYSACYFTKSAIHITSEQNFACDRLSRQGSITSEATGKLLKDVVQFCNPLWSPQNEQDFTTRVITIRSWIKEVLTVSELEDNL
jgi:ribonuclease HI